MANNEQKNVVETVLYKGKVTVRFYPDSHRYFVSVNGGKFIPKTGVTTIIGIKDKSKPLGIWQQQITADYLLDLIQHKKVINIDRALEAVVQCDVAKEKAADIGSEIHYWCECYIRNKLKQEGFENVPDIPKFPEAVTGVNSFLEWEKKHKVKFISTEKIRYSMEHDYIGIEDFEAVIDDKYSDGDFKSSNGLYNSVRLQTVAYAHARMEEGGRKSKKRWAIRLAKYTEEEYMKREERKREMKKAICRIQNKPYQDYGITPYQVFEAKDLDGDSINMQRDLNAFLSALELFRWNKQTDPFYNKGNW